MPKNAAPSTELAPVLHAGDRRVSPRGRAFRVALEVVEAVPGEGDDVEDNAGAELA